MVCRYDGRPLRITVLAALVALGFALPAAAQNLVVGKVTDVKGAPVEGATVTIEQPSSGRKYETKTGKDGTYTQVGLIVAPTPSPSQKKASARRRETSTYGGRVPATSSSA